MSVSKLSPSRLSESPRFPFAARARQLVYAAMAALSLNAVACSGNGGNGNHPETGGTETGGNETGGRETGGNAGAGNAETGGNETGGTAGSGNVETGGGGITNGGAGGAVIEDPCYLQGKGDTADCDPLYICNTILAQDLKPGDTGEWEAPLDGLQNNAKFRLRIDDPNTIQTENTVAVVRYAVSGSTNFTLQGDETQLESFSGINTAIVDRDDPFDETCALKDTPLGAGVDYDVTQVWGEVYHENKGVLEKEDVLITEEGTTIEDVTENSNRFFVDTPPENVQTLPSVRQLANGKVRVTLNPDQFTDEGVTLPPSLTTLKIGGTDLQQVTATVWETPEAVSAGTETDLTVLGANGTVQGHMADELVMASLPVTVETTDPCETVTCGDNAACVDGTCECEANMVPSPTNPDDCEPETVDLCAGTDCDDNNECTVDACDPVDGTCDNTPDTGASCSDGDDNTINDACNAGGVCEGEAVECTTNAQCDDSNVCNGEETCVDNSCQSGTPLDCDDGLACTGTEICDTVTGCESGTPVDCGSHGSCEEPAGSCGCTDGYTGDSCEVAPAAPVISGLGIDCSGGPVPGLCAAGGFDYPVNFNVTGANDCSASPEVISGAGTPGSTSIVNLIGDNGSFDYTTGSNGGNTIRITVNCNGDGGNDSAYTDVYIQ